MAGQAHHFRQYAPEKIPYGIDRYTNEVNRLYGVMNKRLADRDFLAGDYSIADMAAIGWVKPYKNQGQDIDDFPHLKRWFDAMHGAAGRRARPCGRRRSTAATSPTTRKRRKCCSASARAADAPDPASQRSGRRVCAAGLRLPRCRPVR